MRAKHSRWPSFRAGASTSTGTHGEDDNNGALPQASSRDSPDPREDRGYSRDHMMTRTSSDKYSDSFSFAELHSHCLAYRGSSISQLKRLFCMGVRSACKDVMWHNCGTRGRPCNTGLSRDKCDHAKRTSLQSRLIVTGARWHVSTTGRWFRTFWENSAGATQISSTTTITTASTTTTFGASSSRGTHDPAPLSRAY